MRIKKSNFSKLLKSILALVCLSQSVVFAAEMSAGEAQIAREKLIAGAKEELGKPYEYGAVGPDSFDGSGFVYYVTRTYIDYKLPRTAKGIYNDVRIISDSKKEPGDLLFFKMSDNGTISHVGIYIGNNQFISAISDNDEPGVSISQLSSDYWKSRYVAAGQFLPSGKAIDPVTKVEKVAEPKEEESENKTSKVKKSQIQTQKIASSKTKSKKDIDEEEVVTVTEKPKSPKVKDKTVVTSGRSEGTIADKIIVDGTVFFDWSLLSPRQFVFRYRGIDALAHVRYAGWALEPGFGIAYRYNYGLDTMQMPITLSITLNDYFRLYAGPVITFSNANLIDTDKQIKASVFPGVAGVSITTPSYDLRGFAIQGVQDISYTYYNNMDGSALPFMEGVAAGLVMYTGIRIAFPVSIFGRGK